MNSSILKLFMFLAASFLLFSCGEDEVIQSSTEDCPDLAFTYSIDGAGYYFEADFPGIETISWYGWTVNGDFVEDEGNTVNGDNLFETNFPIAGSYEVCIMTETGDCPQGITYCETIVVEGDSNPSTDCAEMSLVYTESPTEHQFAVSFPNEDGPEIVFWSVNGEYVGDGLIYSADFSTAGTYEVCAGIETADCPLGSFVCHTVTVTNDQEPPADECPEMEITYTQNGADFVFTANYEGTLDWFGWAIDGEYVEDDGSSNNGDDMLSYTFSDLGTYTVCILHESPTCPFLQECIDVTVE